MIVSGKTNEEHLKNLESVLKRLQDAGLKANKEKCEFFRDRVQFCGHEIDKEGLHKTQEKIEVVVSAPRPENVSQLRSFLGLVNYYNRFLPNTSTVLHPLHQLLEQNSLWQWTEQCEQAFTEAKRMITSEQVLTQVLIMIQCYQLGSHVMLHQRACGSFTRYAGRQRNTGSVCISILDQN